MVRRALGSRFNRRVLALAFISQSLEVVVHLTMGAAGLTVPQSQTVMGAVWGSMLLVVTVIFDWRLLLGAIGWLGAALLMAHRPDWRYVGASVANAMMGSSIVRVWIVLRREGRASRMAKGAPGRSHRKRGPAALGATERWRVHRTRETYLTASSTTRSSARRDRSPLPAVSTLGAPTSQKGRYVNFRGGARRGPS